MLFLVLASCWPSLCEYPSLALPLKASSRHPSGALGCVNKKLINHFCVLSIPAWAVSLKVPGSPPEPSPDGAFGYFRNSS